MSWLRKLLRKKQLRSAKMESIFARNELVYGSDYLEKIRSKHVAIFGLGGVGGFALEALARAGVENFTLVDFDTVSPSNINRQLIALHSTVNIKKTELFEKRLTDINPNIKLRIFDEFYSEQTSDKIFDAQIDYVIDAIDTMKSKILLLKTAYEKKIPTATSLGAGNRKNPTQFYICDISEIEAINDNFAKNITKQLAKNGITKGIKVVCSRELPIKVNKQQEEKTHETGTVTKAVIGSTPFAPAIAGYYLGYAALSDLLG